jgi:hypothetical protein
MIIEKFAVSFAARSRSELLDLNHTSKIESASVLQIAKFVPHVPHKATNFAIRTLV